MTLVAQEADLPGVVILTPQRFFDERGHFEEVWSRRAFLEVGIDIDFVQDNRSLSLKKGTLRGLHYQSSPYAQAKLVRCTQGAIFDVAVDIRKTSSSYGRSFGIELTPDNGKQLFIPEGFLHGFVTLVDDTEVHYKCSNSYAPHAEGTVRWDSVGIAWPLDQQPIISAKDAVAMPFSEFVTPFDGELV